MTFNPLNYCDKAHTTLFKTAVCPHAVPLIPSRLEINTDHSPAQPQNFDLCSEDAVCFP